MSLIHVMFYCALELLRCFFKSFFAVRPSTVFPLSDSSLPFWSHLISSCWSAFTASSVSATRLIMCVFLCLCTCAWFFIGFPRQITAKRDQVGTVYISIKTYPLPPNLPTDHSKLTTLRLFLSFSLCGRGWTNSFPITWPSTFARAYRNYYSYCFQRTATPYDNGQTEAELMLLNYCINWTSATYLSK